MAEEPAAGSVHVFGVRHLSPAGAWHLRRFLDRVRPLAVLVEGLTDAAGLIPDMTRRETEPPIAILAYTEDLPVRTLVYPIARYSPEYQALIWARENGARAEWIDLPSDVFLALRTPRREPEPVAGDDATGDEAVGSTGPEVGAPEAAGDGVRDLDELLASTGAPEPESLYERAAARAGERDYETYWERSFEHNLAADSYRLAAAELGRNLRELDRDHPVSVAENLVREAFMRRRIRETVESGIPPGRIVAVVGAYHASALATDLPPMSDEELAALPRRASRLTLMPYSYFKLSSQSGYGAGNHAPAYFELLWQALEEDDPGGVAPRYLSRVARHVRGAGTHRSTAEVIEGVRLARALTTLQDGQAPTLADLRDAAITLLGHGHRLAIRDALAEVEIGTAIGRLPEGVSRTSIQDDFERQLRRLRLEDHRTGEPRTIGLDLRENRRVASEEAAYLDLARSSFLHRLRMLGVPFATPERTRQEGATWAESWTLHWTPESEIALVEAVLLGETVELATAYRFQALLDACTSIDAAAGLVDDACRCGLGAAMESARRRLQELAAGTSRFGALASAARRLGLVVRYGDVRRFDTEPLVPLVQELFVGAALCLHGAAACDDAEAREMMLGVDALEKVALEFHDRVDEPLWLGQLQRLADADDRNPMLSGFACAVLVERGALADAALAVEVSRRLSPGVPADLGAGWFEGLAQRNRYALLARQSLWEQLAGYVAGLDEEDFRRALVFLRRAFASFSAREKRHIAENLAEHWGVHEDTLAESLEAPLSADEEQALEDLADFDFDDL